MLRADDPIPKGTILIGDAFERVIDMAHEHRLPLGTDDVWKLAIELHMKEAEQSFDEAMQQEDRQDYQRRIESIALFRNALAYGGLRTYVRDPSTGDILQLDDWQWVDERWLVGLEPLCTLVDDYVDPNGPMYGPSGTVVRGAHRRVFLYADDLEGWIKQTFRQETPRIASSEPDQKISPYVPAHKKEAVKEAILDLFGPKGPVGFSERARKAKIDEWLRNKGADRASEVTIRRALRELRDRS